MKKLLLSLAGALAASSLAAQSADTFFIEAESFQKHGGWKLDTQFIEIMGSPYLLAHGLGRPVDDATTEVTLPGPGAYRVFVRTKDWVAHWGASGAPGKFQLKVNGEALPATFGSEGAEWHWQSGGSIEISHPKIKLTLHDQTGFDGRCDAILFTKDPAYTPPNTNEPLAQWRKQLLGLEPEPAEAGPYDLVIVGGGYAGTAMSLSAARNGIKVALIQNRPVLGGNGSSEIRVWAKGGTRTGLYPKLGEIVEEFMDRAKNSPGTYEEFGDDKKEKIVRQEGKIDLRLNHHAYKVETDGNRIVAVTALNTMTSEEVRFTGRLFADCTGHATIGALAGADHTVQKEGHLGMSNMWRWEETDSPQEFPDVPWALDLTMQDFPYPRHGKGEWFWESGFDKHPLEDLEYIRDWNLRAVYGSFNAMKNKGGAGEHRNARLLWVAHIGGNRESRQLLGDVILTRDDIVEKREFPDGSVPTTWDIDLHYPKKQYMKKYPENPFISYAHFDRTVDRKHGYPVPYRCFYSRNIENLFMAGRCVSVTHEALGTVRVMKTGGMMGEVVGKAAALCTLHNCLPRDVYHSYLGELKELMSLPGAARRDALDSEFYVPEDAPKLMPRGVEFIDPATLPGIVIDDAAAELEGNWKSGEGLKNYIGDHYLYHSRGGKGSATFKFQVDKTGTYEVRISHQEHPNRSSKTPVTVYSADPPKTTRVNQREKPALDHGFLSLGLFRFEAGQPAAVLITNEDIDGNAHADAVQILPVNVD